jgi:ATP/maltotriose-dependent transcriptional regulator MalT
VALLALIHATKGETDPARKYLVAAIGENRDIPDVLPTSFVLAGMALYLMAQGQDDKAAEMLSIIVNHPITDTEFQDKMRPHLARLHDSLSPEMMSQDRQRAEAAITEARRSGTDVILVPAYFDQLIGWLESSPVKTPADVSQALVGPLSPRELEILALIADGHTNQEIADQLYIGITTVKKHINHIFSKLVVTHRAEAVARARALNLLP